MTARRIGPANLARISSPGWVLGLLFAINLVNYLDRLLAVAAGPTLKLEFGLSDRDIGLLASAFLVIYTVAALPLGLLADRVARARVVALGVGLWSVASGATAFCRSFGGLLATRAAVGIGEASYFPSGTALLSAYFPLKRRARAMSQAGAGQVVGIALAFALAGMLDHALGPRLGWRLAFAIAAVPGLALAAVMWFVRDRPAEAAEQAEMTVATPTEPPPIRFQFPTRAELARALLRAVAQIAAVLRIRTVVLGTLLQAIVYIVATPTITFLTIYVPSPASGFHLTPGQAVLVSGSVIVLGGLTGTLLGGYLSDWLSLRLPGGRILVIGLGFGAALPCYLVALLTHVLPLFLVAATLAVVALTLQVGPLGAVVQDATPEGLRASAVAVSLVLAHLLGDAWATSAVGAISTALGERANLGLLIVGLPALVVGVVVALLGARVYLADVAARASAADGGDSSKPSHGGV